MSNDTVLVLVVITALAFDFTNGFHDTGNAMATSIATGALGPRTIRAVTHLDVSAELPIAMRSRSGLILNARVENALNKRYEDVLHFAAPGRTVLIGARASTLF